VSKEQDLAQENALTQALNVRPVKEVFIDAIREGNKFNVEYLLATGLLDVRKLEESFLKEADERDRLEAEEKAGFDWLMVEDAVGPDLLVAKRTGGFDYDGVALCAFFSSNFAPLLSRILTTHPLPFFAAICKAWCLFGSFICEL